MNDLTLVLLYWTKLLDNETEKKRQREGNRALFFFLNSVIVPANNLSVCSAMRQKPF